MYIFTEVDAELDNMQKEICEPIQRKIKNVVEKYFPIDAELYEQYSGKPVDDFMKSINHPVKLSDLDIERINAGWADTKGNKIEFIEQTIRRYGYLPITFIEILKERYNGLADSMNAIIGYCEENTDSLSAKDKLVRDECKKLLGIIKEALAELERGIEISRKRENLSPEKMIEDYKEIFHKRDWIDKKLNFNDGFNEENESDDEISVEELLELQKELSGIKDKWKVELKDFLQYSFFIHRCRCYSNNVSYKMISEEEFVKLWSGNRKIQRKNFKDYIKKMLDTFAVVNRSAEFPDEIQYPEKLELVLFAFMEKKKWREALSEFNRIRHESKRMADSKESKFYRTSISELENEVFERDENYSYELCCAWNELGGFGLSGIIAGSLFYESKIITKDFLTRKKEKMEEFYSELERCCKLLIDFSKSESWLMGMELTHRVFYMYCRYWQEQQDKKPSLEELCVSMKYMAEVLELIPFKEILDHYSYKEQMIGCDGIPRRDFSVLWEDDKGKYERYFYRKELEKYADGSNVNLFYIRVFQIVFRCVNGDSWK